MIFWQSHELIIDSQCLSVPLVDGLKFFTRAIVKSLSLMSLNHAWYLILIRQVVWIVKWQQVHHPTLDQRIWMLEKKTIPFLTFCRKVVALCKRCTLVQVCHFIHVLRHYCWLVHSRFYTCVIYEHSRVDDCWYDFWIEKKRLNVICPHVCRHRSSWNSCHDDLRCSLQIVLFLNVLQVGSRDVGTAQVKFGAFVRNGRCSVSLMKASITVCEDKFGPVGESASIRVSWRHTLRNEWIKHVSGASEISFASLITILNGLIERKTPTAASSPKEYQKLIFLGANMLI